MCFAKHRFPTLPLASWRERVRCKHGDPAPSSQSGMCAAVTAQSGKVIGAGAALDCQGGVPLCALPLCSFKAARAFLSCRFGVPEQSVAKAIAALTIYEYNSYYYKCEPVDIVIAAIDLAPDLGRSRRQTRYQCSL